MRLVSDIRAVPRRKRKFPPATSAVRGYLTLNEAADPIPYQSDLERQFLVMCACLPWVINVVWEPMTFHFRDELAALERSYTPDFRVDYQDGKGDIRTVIIETKRMKDYLRTAGYMAPCYAAAHQWAIEQENVRFDYVSDDWLQSTGIASFEFIYQARKSSLPHALRSELVKELLNQSGLTLKAAIFLLMANGVADENIATATLMALVSDGYVGFEMSKPLSLETRIHGAPIENPFAACIFPAAAWRQNQV